MATTPANDLGPKLQTTVLSNRRVAKGQKKWGAGIFMAFGIMLLVSGAMVTIETNGRFAQLAFMVGFGIFLFGICLKFLEIGYAIWRDGANRK